MNPEERAEYARINLERARALRSEGDLAKAERALRRVLAVDPRNRRARLLRIELLEELGRTEELGHERRMARLPGRYAPVPAGPLDLPSRNVLVIVSGSNVENGRTFAYVSAMTDELASVVVGRIELRLPEARVVRRVPASVEQAREWLRDWNPRAVIGLRGRKAFCGYSAKDGRFAVAELDVVTGRGGAPLAEIALRETLYDPPDAGCVRAVGARVTEQALARPEVRAALSAEGEAPGANWTAAALRQLFAGLDAAIVARTEAGRRAMARGRFEEALAAFSEAEGMDSEDPRVRAYRVEARATLDLRQELHAASQSFVADVASAAEPGPQTAASSVRALLADAEDDHDAVLAVVERSIGQLPHTRSRAGLHTVVAPERDSVGTRLARSRAAGPVEALLAEGESGALLYFRPGAVTPLLRALDLNGDGRPERWIGYRNGVHSELWEDGSGDGAPDLHVVFSPEGTALERIEIDGDFDGRPERILAYADGKLVSVAWDSNGDGELDRVERFDEGTPSGPREDEQIGLGRPKTTGLPADPIA
jgi:tetratricopeptide (TPR) repeat protein